MTERTEVVPLSDKLSEEQELTRREAIANQREVEPTPDETRNGWTKESLTKYLAERDAARTLMVDVNSITRKAARRKSVQNHRYRVLRWRG